MKLRWKKLHPNAQAPAVAHVGMDLGYDLFAVEDIILRSGRVTLVRTGIAIEFDPPHGALLFDRSSMGNKGIKKSAGVIDAGYRGEILVQLTLDMDAPPGKDETQVGGYMIRAGDKIAQMIPVKPLTIFDVEEVDALSSSTRGEKGFGSSGK